MLTVDGPRRAVRRSPRWTAARRSSRPVGLRAARRQGRARLGDLAVRAGVAVPVLLTTIDGVARARAARPRRLALAGRGAGRGGAVCAGDRSRPAGPRHRTDRHRPAGAGGGRRHSHGQRRRRPAGGDGARGARRFGRGPVAGAPAADAHADLPSRPGGLGQRRRGCRAARGHVRGHLRHLADQSVRRIPAGAGPASVAVGDQPGPPGPAARPAGAHRGGDRAGGAGGGLLRQRVGLRAGGGDLGDGAPAGRTRRQPGGGAGVERRPGVPAQRGDSVAAGGAGLTQGPHPGHRSAAPSPMRARGRWVERSRRCAVDRV